RGSRWSRRCAGTSPARGGRRENLSRQSVIRFADRWGAKLVPRAGYSDQVARPAPMPAYPSAPAEPPAAWPFPVTNARAAVAYRLRTFVPDVASTTPIPSSFLFLVNPDSSRTFWGGR